MRIWAPQYPILGGILYRKGEKYPWYGCIDRELGKQALQEAHVGPIGAYKGAIALTGKILRMGICWLDIHEDATKVTRTCVKCQPFS